MTELFGDATPFWGSIASRALGWRPTEFWQATPQELVASLGSPSGATTTAPPSQETIRKMIERDSNG
ncbi:MAG: phage tail assembly chaperone [Pseudomonadota bacterium]